ncbi:MAG TPA: BolA family protein [Gammaproteobacteria bacterium]|nr:BolA family protein [Gammaproteobacteria bacterium]
MNVVRIERIRERLKDAFDPPVLEIIDEGHMHVGHAGARDGRGHFRIRVVSSCFQELRLLQRHRMVYAALADLLETDVHALRIEALTPEEVRLVSTSQ